MRTFKITETDFQLDDRPIQLISGAIHYFRVVPELWEDRLSKLKACGLNCVETYVPWNAHEPQPGRFDFSGILDLVRFVEMAGKLDLLVIVRPSPYICAEWEFGGLPAWLLAQPDMRLRCNDRAFLDCVDRYYDHLLPLLAPLQVTQGGPIIAMQIENEYGSYGNDKEYLQHLEQAMISRGIDVPLFTSDGPEHGMLQGGTLPHIFKTANFGGRVEESFARLREYQPSGPLMCMEYWNGWFDHWGAKHHTRDAADAARCLDEILAMGASVNLYMFHGGTNFGFMNGANCDRTYQPTVTSYDYDAAVSESGDLTPKYFAFREVIARHRRDKDISASPLPSLPEPLLKIAPGTVALTHYAPLLPNLGRLAPEAAVSTVPLPMEKVGQNNGFILYRTRLSGPRDRETLHIQEVRDRALVFQDGRLIGVRYRNDNPTESEPITLSVRPEGSVLEILVENMGRTNYGPQLWDPKGITEGVRLSNQFQFGWEIFPLPLESADLAALRYEPACATDQPAFYRGIFSIENPADTFVALGDGGWTKGVCWVNGFNLGRYWNYPPERNLYLPGPLLRTGDNEIVLLELHGNQTISPTLKLTDHP